VVVENRVGGGTVIGTEAAAKADPDGHTILIASVGFTTNQMKWGGIIRAKNIRLE